MRTCDALRDEALALRLALESGNGACPSAPLTAYRDGWKGQSPMSVFYVSNRQWAAAIRRWQVGSLARRIWESLPYAQRYWMYGETEAEMRKNRRRG